ncbi:MAG: carbon-nitrogen hydrolase family protein, partial [Gemmatimonadales bacterium]|nr:carbon-nitrogen hydrolase family protein [Gemmatimonadales bacterium]
MNRPSDRTVRVAVVQAEVPPSLDAALAEVERQVASAAAAGCTMVVFGETWLPGYPAWLDHCPGAALWDHAPTKAVFARLADDSVDVAGEGGAALAYIAAAHGVTIVIGVVERVASGPGRGTLYNSLLTYGSDGALLNHHRKLVPTYTERLVWGPGDAQGLRAVETAGARVGGLVCWEHWMPLARQALHDCGEDVHVAAWPTAHEMHQVASRHYAFEGRCFVLVAAGLMRAGSLPPELDRTEEFRDDDAWVVRGGSAIIGPDGAYIAEPVWDGPA